jgi:hypothetical protein
MSVSMTTNAILTRPIKLSSTAPTTLLDVQSRTTVISVLCAEIAGATPALTLEIFDGTTSHYIRNAKPMGAKELFVLEGPITINASWLLRATASAANQIDIFVNYLPSTPAAAGAFIPLKDRSAA